MREHPDIAFFAHPTLAAARAIAPPLLFGKLFRMLGADAVIFPNHGGRFGYSPETCAPSPGGGGLAGLASDCAQRAGAGRRHDAVSACREMLDFYGADTMLLIGGALLAGRVEATRLDEAQPPL